MRWSNSRTPCFKSANLSLFGGSNVRENPLSIRSLCISFQLLMCRKDGALDSYLSNLPKIENIFAAPMSPQLRLTIGYHYCLSSELLRPETATNKEETRTFSRI